MDHWVALIGIAGLAVSTGCIAASAVDINAGSYAQQTGEELYRGQTGGWDLPAVPGYERAQPGSGETEEPRT